MTKGFSSPKDPIEFNSQVWEIVCKIPSGKVATYGQIAQMIPPPDGMETRSYRAQGPRWVGGAMANCPSDVPWHRVINSQGKISLRNRPGYEQQRILLENEGVTFDQRNRVDLKKFRWHGPESDSPSTSWHQASFDDLL